MAWRAGLERPLRKHAGGMFLGRGRVLGSPDASIRMWTKIRKCEGVAKATLFFMVRVFITDSKERQPKQIG